MPESLDLLADRVFRSLESYTYNCSSEAELQSAIQTALEAGGFAVSKEHRLSDRDRLDFFVEGRLAIEVKVGGSLTDLLRQLQRYASHDAVEGLLVVTTRSALTRVPPTLQGKPVRSLRLWGAAL